MAQTERRPTSLNDGSHFLTSSAAGAAGHRAKMQKTMTIVTTKRPATFILHIRSINFRLSLCYTCSRLSQKLLISCCDRLNCDK